MVNETTSNLHSTQTDEHAEASAEPSAAAKNEAVSTQADDSQTQESQADDSQTQESQAEASPVEGLQEESSVAAAAEESAAGSDAVEADAAESDDAQSNPETQLLLPLAEMTPTERHRATTRLIFLAPDVPPVQPRQRRTDFRQLDEILERQFSRGRDPRDRERDDDEDRDGATNRRRSRRRQDSDSSSTEEPQRREQKQTPPATEPQRVRGSTRLEAKKQRRRDGRDTGRRRRLVITESEFLARRESVNREMIVRTTNDRIQIGVLEDKVLVEHYVARSSESSLIGNVYLGRVQNVLPSMEAAFVDIGRGRNAVLYSGEVDWSEFQGASSARRIENVLKPGDQVLVQVTKDPVGHKGARLTSQISLPGRFLVYVPGGSINGISRKLPDTERARLKKILKEVLPSGAGVIVRTAAEGATEEQITGDVQRLTRQWESIQQRVEKGGGPVLLHSEPDMLIKIVRDVFNEDFHKLVIQGDDTYQVIEQYLSQVAPELLERVERYEATRDIFDEYRINEQIIKALDRKVWLPSGGSLVIDRTEAMTVVDVNTGKFVGSGGNLEETVTKNNLEAAEEIVRQLRLRDIGGIIVIDFIDMVLENNRDLVLRRLVECLNRDRTKHQVAEVTSLGLVQMTRKKLGLGLLEAFSDTCETCAGRGLIVHHEPVHRHRNESPARTKRKSNAPQQNGAQTHAITDESRSAMAKIAASTITATSDQQADETAPEQAEGAASESTGARASSSNARGSRGQRSSRSSNKTRADSRARRSHEASSADTPDVEPAQQPSRDDLLGSVLDALPPAPEPGQRRRVSRRVSTTAIRGDDEQGHSVKIESTTED